MSLLGGGQAVGGVVGVPGWVIWSEHHVSAAGAGGVCGLLQRVLGSVACGVAGPKVWLAVVAA